MQPRLGLRQPVVDPEPLLAAGDEPMLAQIGKVPGDGRLGDAQGLEEMADAHLVPLAAEQIQEAQRTGSANALSVRVDSSSAGGFCLTFFILLTEYRSTPRASQASSI